MLPVHPDVSIHTLVRSIEGNDDLKVAAATYFPTDLQHLAKKMLSYAFPIMASGGLFGLYLIGKSVYNLVNVEEKMIVKGKSVNGLIMALRQKAENAHAIEFHFNGALYTLTEHQGNLILRDANNNIVHAFQNLTLTMLYERIPNIGQIKESIQLCDSLSDKLSQGAQQTFKCFLNPILIGTPDCNPPYVLGDHDGSTARMVLAAMRAGYITMDEQGLGMLAQVMELEAEVLAAENLALAKQNKVQADDLFKAFQQNEAARLTDLLDHMTFHAGYTLLISIGDGRNDRLSTDKDLDDQIRERLFDVGAKFIAGNHELLKTQHTRGVSFGDFAKDETSRGSTRSDSRPA